MAESTLKEKLEKFGIKTAINYLRKDPEKNLPKLMDMIDKADKDGTFAAARYSFHQAIDDPNSPWNHLIYRVVKGVDPHVLETFLQTSS